MKDFISRDKRWISLCFYNQLLMIVIDVLTVLLGPRCIALHIWRNVFQGYWHPYRQFCGWAIRKGGIWHHLLVWSYGLLYWCCWLCSWLLLWQMPKTIQGLRLHCKYQKLLVPNGVLFLFKTWPLTYIFFFINVFFGRTKIDQIDYWLKSELRN